MKKIKDLSESTFLTWVFAMIAVVFLLAAVCMPDRSTMLSGLVQIVSQPSKLSTNYFAVGGYAATFLNMGLVALCCVGLFIGFGAAVNNVSNLAFLLTLGFCSWGIHVLNIWPTILGVLLYCLVMREKPAAHVNAMLFSTGIAPLITDLMIRYPHAEAVGFTPGGVVLSLLIGLAFGFFLPAGLAASSRVHRGFDLYSAALPVGMAAFLLQGILYKSMGVALPAGADTALLQIASATIVNIFCCSLFGLFIILALLLGCRFRDYWKLLIGANPSANLSADCGYGMYLMNMGVYGLFILGYYNLVGASFNAVTFGIVFCMLACCDSGSHPGNVLPIMLGYIAASLLFGRLSAPVGGSFSGAINAQGILVGLCYANGLSPISSKYGWGYGFLAAMMHYAMVTTVPNLHGGFCLYNGGFTAALVCILLVPILERFCHLKSRCN